MAFLDNSGDIILDAVLTDVGRKRMAAGDFKISKFAVGDDEIDYGLYNKNHPSGSAYYDLEILQTPVLEAFTQINANINYGLVSYSRQDLLYMPSIVLNEKSAVTEAVIPQSGVINLCDNTVFIDGKSALEHLSDDLGGKESLMDGHGNPSPHVALIETGILTSELTPTSDNQANYLLSVGLTDNSFIVKYDVRFIKSVLGPTTGDSFSNSTGRGILNVSLSLAVTSGTDASVNNYVQASVNGLLNRVYYNNTVTTDSSINYSAINGPRGNFTALTFVIDQNISQQDYISYGKTSQTIGSHNYDYIDTIVYVQGASTNVSLQLPIRIIKLTT